MLDSGFCNCFITSHFKIVCYSILRVARKLVLGQLHVMHTLEKLPLYREKWD